jgi:hypothetical protein
MAMTLKKLVVPYLWKYLTVCKDELCKITGNSISLRVLFHSDFN